MARATRKRENEEPRSPLKRARLEDGDGLSHNSRARVDGTTSRPTNGSFPEATWLYARTPTERHYLIQNKRCDLIKPYTSENWTVNGPVQKCTSCSLKVGGGGICRFEGLRAFAAVLVGEELQSFNYDVRIHDEPEVTAVTTVTDTRQPRKAPQAKFKPALLGLKGSEQPDFKDWVLLGSPGDFKRLSTTALDSSNPYPHGVSEAHGGIMEVIKNLSLESSKATLTKAGQSAFDILRLIAPTLHGILSRAAPYFTASRTDNDTQSPVILRSPVPNERVTCDSCGTTCFLGSWVCVLCGRERCVDCWSSWKIQPGLLTPRLDKCANRKRHTRSHFYVVKRSNAAEVDWLLHHTSPTVWSLVGGVTPQFIDLQHDLGGNNVQNLPVDLLASFKEFLSQNNSCPLLGHSIGPLVNLTVPETYTYRGRPVVRDMHIGLLKNSRPLLPTVEAKDLSSEIFPYTECLFRNIWHLQGDRTRGMPIVISGMLDRFNVAWTPDYFIRNYGDEQCWVVNCSTNETVHGGETVTVGEFFSAFDTHSFRGVTSSMKLKDWPPHEDFATHFPELFQDFQRALPFPDRMSRGGFANLASHFPREVLQPDLGPKMYCAYPAPEYCAGFSGEEKGSTRLHLDVTCAINIMAYAAPATADGETPSPPGAIWDIFEPRDTQILNSYLRHKYSHVGVDDPVNRQLFYLSSDDLCILNTEKWNNTRSFRILQEPGDAVLIPAGCAHQVANGRSSIKVAVDFIAAERIHVCEDVMTMFRDMAAQYKYPLHNADGGNITAEGGSGTEDGGSGSRTSKSKPRKRRPAAPVVTKVSLGMKEDILQLYNCLYFTFFQIRGLGLSLKLRDYGPGWERADIITQGKLPDWQQAPSNGVTDVREDKSSLKVSEGAKDEAANRIASAAKGEEIPERSKGPGGMVGNGITGITKGGGGALEGSKEAEDGQFPKAETAAVVNEASTQVLELPIHV
ncbi:MAG: hypothetical protein M1840_002059 [Geoglossum simile]|nr:MAG: hypothetical protein M1840_002059 [Geoglossum simile]